jgi:hypothetical protein
VAKELKSILWGRSLFAMKEKRYSNETSAAVALCTVDKNMLVTNLVEKSSHPIWYWNMAIEDRKCPIALVRPYRDGL